MLKNEYYVLNQEKMSSVEEPRDRRAALPFPFEQDTLLFYTYHYYWIASSNYEQCHVTS